jgi:hypothetical protein
MRCLLTVLVLGLAALPGRAQEKTLLPSVGWGSLSGKVTLVGKIPPPEDLTNVMLANPDKACCLAKEIRPE